MRKKYLLFLLLFLAVFGFSSIADAATITRTISAWGNDGFTCRNLSVPISNSLTYLQYGHTVSTTDCHWDIFLLFDNINIPQGSTINNAYIQLYTNSILPAGTNLAIGAADQDNIWFPPTTAWAHESLPRTTAKAYYSIWTSQSANIWVYFNLDSVIQELVSSYDYSGEGMEILIDDNWSALGIYSFYSFEGGAAPILFIDYTPPVVNYNLNLNKTGSTGIGTVTSNPAGINCGTTCSSDSATYPSGTFVTLTAIAGVGSTFAGWSGAGCSGTGFCNVTMNSVKTVTAVFNSVGPAAPTITLSPATAITQTTATINGNITNTGGENPTVTVYWGDNDGGTNPANWDYSSLPTSPGQPQGAVAFSKNLTGLNPGTTYYFSAKATNSGGTSWPLSSKSFPTAAAGPACQSHNVWGWAWSENIGWASFSCEDTMAIGTGVDYGVDIDDGVGAVECDGTKGRICGYAWSENIGWISFNRADTGVPPGQPNYGTHLAEVDLDNGEVSGWARALANGGGWDGWIKLRKYSTDGGSDYGVYIDPGTGDFYDWAWGADVVGWLSFNARNCDPDGNGLSNGVGACPAAGTAIASYKVETSFIFNRPPVAAISCSPASCTVYENDALVLNNDSTDPDSPDIVTSEWDIVGENGLEYAGSGAPDFMPNFTPQSYLNVPNSYTARLKVIDTKNASSTATIGYTILQDVEADFDCSLDGVNWLSCPSLSGRVFQGEVVYFRDISTLSDGAVSITLRDWTKDGILPPFDNSLIASTTLDNPFNTIELTVQDNAGRSDSQAYIISTMLHLPDWIEVPPTSFLGKLLAAIFKFFKL